MNDNNKINQMIPRQSFWICIMLSFLLQFITLGSLYIILISKANELINTSVQQVAANQEQMITNEIFTWENLINSQIDVSNEEILTLYNLSNDLNSNLSNLEGNLTKFLNTSQSNILPSFQFFNNGRYTGTVYNITFGSITMAQAYNQKVLLCMLSGTLSIGTFKENTVFFDFQLNGAYVFRSKVIASNASFTVPLMASLNANPGDTFSLQFILENYNSLYEVIFYSVTCSAI